jgi:hypothetical protein
MYLTHTPHQNAEGSLKKRKVLNFEVVMLIFASIFAQYKTIFDRLQILLFVKLLLNISTMRNKVIVFSHIFA